MTASPRATSPRLLVVADSDSYLKWAVSRMLEAQSAWEVELVVIRSAVTPSAEQIASAVDARVAGPPPVISFEGLKARLVEEPPDALLLACRGPLIDSVVRDLWPRGGSRPAIAAGIPGIWYPPTALGLRLREAVDVLVLHSHRERRAVRSVAHVDGQRVALATLVPRERSGVDPIASRDRDRVVFAPQALVPSERHQRTEVFQALADLARGRPDLDVIVKLRGRAGEAQTHGESVPYPSLVADLAGPLPSNVTFEHGPLRAYLDGCVGLATVSSTAALEAIAHGVPVLCLDDFGVSDAQLNGVLQDSGLLGDLSALRACDFRVPRAEWRLDNYFHDAADDDWLPALAAAVESPRRGLPAPREGGLRPFLEAQRTRRVALGGEDRTAARIFGFIAAALLTAQTWLRRPGSGARSTGLSG